MKKININIEHCFLTSHAAKRLIDRKITAKEFDELIKNPDEITQQGPKFILSKRFKHRTDNLLAAVLIEKTEKNTWVVITVMINFQIK